jgi:hypothetical protein
LPNGLYQKVTVQADNSSNAKSMIEMQYGKGSLHGIYPSKVSTGGTSKGSK